MVAAKDLSVSLRAPLVLSREGSDAANTTAKHGQATQRSEPVSCISWALAVAGNGRR